MTITFIGTLTAFCQSGDYIIRRGDVVDVVVMEHPEFTIGGITVLPDGTIQYPAFGNVVVAGMSTRALRDSLQTMLDQYIVNPIVSVYIRKLQNQMLTVTGYVHRPGQYQLFESTDVLAAIGMAGGIRNLRRVKQVTIIRADQRVETVDVKGLYGGKRRRMPQVNAGDTIYVGEPRDINWSMLAFVASATTTLLTLVRVLQ